MSSVPPLRFDSNGVLVSNEGGRFAFFFMAIHTSAIPNFFFLPTFDFLMLPITFKDPFKERI